MTIWSPEITGKTGAKYLLIADEISLAVNDGRLAPGTRLPPQRDLAYELGVSLSTVTRAYAEALRHGIVVGEVGRGTFVSAPDGEGGTTSPADGLTRPRSGPINFSLNLPSVGRSGELLANTLADLGRSKSLARLLDYRPDTHPNAHVLAGARWMRRAGLDGDARDVVVTNGAQHGLMVALMATTRPGDVVLVEQLTYAPLKQMAQSLGLKLRAVKIDRHGLVPSHLDAACRGNASATLYCMPTLQTPTGATMPEARRREVAAIARKHDLKIIEDDVYGFLPPERPDALANHARERCLFITSVSKSLAPGLRVGYLLCPVTYRRAVDSAVATSCWMPPPLMAEIASRWIDDGTAEQLNAAQRDQARARQAMASQRLHAHAFQAAPHAFSLWLNLPKHWRAEAFQREAQNRGVMLATGEAFTVGRAQAPHAVRLCLGHEMDNERVAHGLDIVAALLDEAPRPDASVV